jgi:hypothetical protein
MNQQPVSPAVRGAFVVAAAWQVAVAVAAEPPRSNLQPAGEVAATAPLDNALGLRLERASLVLRQQLALKRGAGLVVTEVAPQSRAARAGFAQHDVLVKLDDQLLLLPEQFAALLESAERDGPLECTVLRSGREVVIPLAAAPRRTGPVVGSLRPTPSALKVAAPVASAGRTAAVAAAGPRQVAAETLLRQDADYHIRLTGGDETRLLITEPSGRVVFNAAIDTPEGRSRMPVVVRARVEEMERLLETAPQRPAAANRQGERPAAEIGRLEVAPVEIR